MRRLSEIHEVALFADGTGADQQLFWALHLTARSAPHMRREIGVAYETIKNAVLHRQIRFFFNPRDEPVAFVMWASVDEDVHQRMLSGERFHLHESEWNEGSFLWLIDLVAPFGHGVTVALRLLREALRTGSPESIHLFRPRASSIEVRTIVVTREII